MSDNPRCEYCGKFICIDPDQQGKTWDGKLVWTGGPIPEPSHDVFWHIKCDEKVEAEDVSSTHL